MEHLFPASGESHPHRPAFESSLLWVRETGKVGLVSTHPGSGSHSEEKTHKQSAGPSGLGLVQAQFLGSRARLVGVVPAFRSLRAEALGVRVSEGRAAAVGTPRTQRREGT